MAIYFEVSETLRFPHFSDTMAAMETGGIFNTLLVQPLYNGLVFLMDTLPWPDAGLAIIFLTIIVKIILYPLAKKAIQTQVRMKEMEPELTKIKEKFKTDKQKQAEATIALYREKKINPLSSFLQILIQLPIIFALYRIFLHSNLPNINVNLLYSFVPVPESVSILFLGLIDISGKSLILAALTGISQFIQAYYSIPTAKLKTNGAKPTLQEDFTRNLNNQMKYVFPVVAFLISWQISGVVALYWTTSNVFAIIQEILVRKKLRAKGEIK